MFKRVVNVQQFTSSFTRSLVPNLYDFMLNIICNTPNIFMMGYITYEYVEFQSVSHIKL